MKHFFKKKSLNMNIKIIYQNIIKFDIQVAEVLAVHPLQGRPDLLGHPFGRGLADPVVAHVGRQITERGVLGGEHIVVVNLKQRIGSMLVLKVEV